MMGTLSGPININIDNITKKPKVLLRSNEIKEVSQLYPMWDSWLKPILEEMQ